MKLPILYSKTNTGAIQFWKIEVGQNKHGHGAVKTTFGQLGTDKPQTTLDIIKDGKNIGKKNETTPIGQAQLQAKQKWDKQVKKGYVENLEDAQNGVTKLEGIKPMLAHKFKDRIRDVNNAEVIFAQGKLDGTRCIAVVSNQMVSLFTRTQKPIDTVPHIIKQLEHMVKVFDLDNVVFDGELYNHELRDDFNKLISVIKRDDVHEDSDLIQYHIYDLPSHTGLFSERAKYYADMEAKIELNYKEQLPHIKFVPTVQCTRAEIDMHLVKFLELGYEGLMVRLNGPYENKRSKYLLKYKEFQDDEFEIVGVNEGNGKLMGHAGSFNCLTKEGKPFKAKLKGELENLKEYFVNSEKYIGKALTVEFFNYTPAGIPRFPVGKAVRDYE